MPLSHSLFPCEHRNQAREVKIHSELTVDLVGRPAADVKHAVLTKVFRLLTCAGVALVLGEHMQDNLDLDFFSMRLSRNVSLGAYSLVRPSCELEVYSSCQSSLLRCFLYLMLPTNSQALV